MIRIENRRRAFHQWDVNQRLVVSDPDITEVHFASGALTGALVVDVYEESGTRYADVPNILLQSAWPLRVYGCCEDCVRRRTTFSVIGRERPADYVYTETEVRTWAALDERIRTLEQGGGSGGISEEKDPTVPAWAKAPEKPKYTAKEVGAASEEDVKRLSEEKADEFTVGEGLTMSADRVLSAVGGGSEGVYELIETISLEEAVKRVNLGPYNLKKVYVEVITPVADAVSAGVIAINDINAIYVPYMVSTSSTSANGRIIKCVADTENGMLRCLGQGCNNSDYSQEDLSSLYQRAFAGYMAAKIETVSVFVAPSVNVIPKDAVITIKGVRAK